MPVIDHWWQTETGWPIAANCLGIEPLPVKAGLADAAGARLGRAASSTRAATRCRRARPARSSSSCRCRPAPRRRSGTPTSATASPTSTAFPGYYQTADAGYIDEDGYVFVMGRTDDIINVAGHRLSTGAIEEVLASHPDVAECAVIGVADELKGQLPLGLLVLKAGVDRAARRDRRASSCSSCASGSAPSRRSSPRLVVDRLPKTRSGKILRATMRPIADGEEYTVPATIDDPAILDGDRGIAASGGVPSSRLASSNALTRGVRRIQPL